MVDARPRPPMPSLAQWLSRTLGAPFELSVALPDRMDDGTLPRGPGVWVGVEDPLAPTHHLRLWLDAALALYLVDLGLGGEAGQPPPSGHAAAALDDAELGVLAYLAARGCASMTPPLRLSGLDGDPGGEVTGWLRFPVRVGLGEHALAAAVCVEGPIAARWWPAPALRWVLATDPDGAQALAPGDVLLLPPGPPAGFLRVEGFEGMRAVRRGEGGLRGRPGPAPAGCGLRVELDAGPGTWVQVADLMTESGDALSPSLGGPGARVVGPGDRTWDAELVRLEGRLGVRITAEPL